MLHELDVLLPVHLLVCLYAKKRREREFTRGVDSKIQAAAPGYDDHQPMKRIKEVWRKKKVMVVYTESEGLTD